MQAFFFALSIISNHAAPYHPFFFRLYGRSGLFSCATSTSRVCFALCNCAIFLGRRSRGLALIWAFSSCCTALSFSLSSGNNGFDAFAVLFGCVASLVGRSSSSTALRGYSTSWRCYFHFFIHGEKHVSLNVLLQRSVYRLFAGIPENQECCVGSSFSKMGVLFKVSQSQHSSKHIAI